jgi:hypothetical protein
MQKVFNFGVFGSNDDEFALNAWIQKKKPLVIDYFNELIDVPDPEDYLAINKYVELIQKTKPFIIMTDREIIEMHQLLISYKGLNTQSHTITQSLEIHNLSCINS